MGFSGSVSQHSVACSLEIFSRLLAQIFLLKTRLWFVSACAPGLWEFPEDQSARQTFLQISWETVRLGKRKFLFLLHIGLQLHAIVQLQALPTYAR